MPQVPWRRIAKAEEIMLAILKRGGRATTSQLDDVSLRDLYKTKLSLQRLIERGLIVNATDRHRNFQEVIKLNDEFRFTASGAEYVQAVRSNADIAREAQES